MDILHKFHARELLTKFCGDKKVIGVQYYSGRCLGYLSYSAELLEQMIEDGLLYSESTIYVDDDNDIHLIKVTELGSTFGLLLDLAVMLNSPTSYETQLMSTGKMIEAIFAKTKQKDVQNLFSLLSTEEAEAYTLFCKHFVFQDLSDDPPVLSLSSMFELSVELGVNGDDHTRTNDYVLKKCMEELGELSLEVQIEQGLSYKEQGADGVAGEAVDLAICAMDMFALQYPGMSAREIEQEFIGYMNKKLQKWRTVVGK